MTLQRRPVRALGFTLVEATMCIVIVALMLVAGFAAAGSSARARLTLAEQRSGHALIRGVLAEIQQRPYTDPELLAGFGVEGGESRTDRSTLDDVDDYEGLTESPALVLQGATFSRVPGWQLRVSVTFARFDQTTGKLAASTSDVGLKLIRVTARSPRGVEHAAEALRSATGFVDLANAAGGRAMVATIGLSPADGPHMISAVPLMNAPPE